MHWTSAILAAVPAVLAQSVHYNSSASASSTIIPSHTHLHPGAPPQETRLPDEILANLWSGLPPVGRPTVTTTVEPTPLPTEELKLPPNMPALTSRMRLPKGFIWGMATAAYQVEGAAADDNRGPSIWDVLAKIPSFVTGNGNGDIADNHYYLYKQDILRMKEMGVPFYSFSISWSRVLPNGRGVVNQLALQHYQDVVDYCLSVGIEPIVTLYHWDLPFALQQRFGGWTHAEIKREFVRYAQVCFDALGSKVKYWFTLNEPQVFCNAYQDYAQDDRITRREFDYNGDHPELVKYTCGFYALIAHAAAVEYFHKEIAPRYEGRQISMKQAWGAVYPYDDRDPEDVKAARRALDFSCGWMSDPIYKLDWPKTMRETLGARLPEFSDDDRRLLKGSMDFYAWDGYTGTAVSAPRGGGGIDACARNTSHPLWPECVEHHDTYKSGWPVGAAGDGGTSWLRTTPDLFELGVKYIHGVYRPRGIMIAEFGTTVPGEDAKPTLNERLYDEHRVVYFEQYLHRILALVARDKINVIGALGWSLLDNLEWQAGFAQRFGMMYVDYITQQRMFKKSFYYFTEFFKHYVDSGDKRHKKHNRH